MLTISILSCSAYAQQQTSVSANGFFTAVGKQPLREKIFAHTDKDFYVTR